MPRAREREKNGKEDELDHAEVEEETVGSMELLESGMKRASSAPPTGEERAVEVRPEMRARLRPHRRWCSAPRGQGRRQGRRRSRSLVVLRPATAAVGIKR